jgi:hypothetical protein
VPKERVGSAWGRGRVENVQASLVEGKCGPENTTKIWVPEAGFRDEVFADHEAALGAEGYVVAAEVVAHVGRW